MGEIISANLRNGLDLRLEALKRLALNAPAAAAPNVLMDVPEKYPGITHIALLCPDIMAAKAHLEAAGIPLSGGPIQFTPGKQAIFVRDPDPDVMELHQLGNAV